ncbi:MAG: phospho-N-acetylmuramoyl-pentapeptide-transferase [Buchnera aphidicola (Brevicoryne brassicae)]|uniref:Phospho-N-acetylmuramoyl-pentapeptide-transferase n=1 Tax=Buchnera aphidicola (Brevicoryne brassicae) TaxID=911343 RepID=A0AAJ5PUM8_9GAMM|nr:phospho-N-acetylmuramoyl-pentapeptide-transferase [Buchnera aphidicola]QCI19791.1 phospho-N-acetylmuramoyl-pentapeptide-transferase [Buchnera aphidicola (Brevicoryne brassicae)]WAI19163.1 MAG: phospho-N-acetylmuramoyl-pentapeptide-transferase [Buchnera aphidicola (Brevicoryne brassicae)]
MLILLHKYLNSYFNIIYNISYRAVFSLLTSFFINLYIGPYFIYFFRKIQKYQTIRKNGPKTHYLKNKTPTMGGLFIIISIIFSIFLYCDLSNRYIWYIMSILLGYGLIGFLDDYKKIKNENSQGLTIIYKYFLLSIFALGIIYIIYNNSENIISTQLTVPLCKKNFEINYFYIFLSYFVIVGTSNAVNLTDGLDGLAIMPIVFLACGFTLISLLSANAQNSDCLNISYIKNSDELVVLCTAIIGSGLGFLWFNSYPAKIFMGDVGSLSLGGSLGVIAILLHQELLLIIMGGVFVIETISVILQIISFKIRKKRIFKMAPIHHHYEIKGILEPVIIVRFWIISLILLLISLISLKVC